MYCFLKEKKIGQVPEDLVPHFNFPKMLRGHPEHATALSQACVSTLCRVTSEMTSLTTGRHHCEHLMI